MEEQKRNPAAGLSESEQVQVRRQKLADLQAAGNDPFTLTKFPQDAYSADLKEEFKELPKMCIRDSLYAVQKEILRRMYGLELGSVRAPMPGLIPEDEPIVAEAQAMIEAAIAKL